MGRRVKVFIPLCCRGGEKDQYIFSSPARPIHQHAFSHITLQYLFFFLSLCSRCCYCWVKTLPCSYCIFSLSLSQSETMATYKEAESKSTMLHVLSFPFLVTIMYTSSPLSHVTLDMSIEVESYVKYALISGIGRVGVLVYL